MERRWKARTHPHTLTPEQRNAVRARLAEPGPLMGWHFPDPWDWSVHRWDYNKIVEPSGRVRYERTGE